MRHWWEKSPYSVFNLYLGGVSFYCRDQPLDALWVNQVVQQGWSFILTWVGPQAPCSNFKYKMSDKPPIAYNQGREEAEAAAQAAEDLDILGDKIIYYDLEGYSDPGTSCRDVVHSFLQGWNERLHELGLKAGGYGGACSSYISEWAQIQPPPDDVWMAHWYRSFYDPNASVWDTPCVPNELWANHQRIKQYTGGHKETWGDVSLTLDSNVLDGEITAISVVPVSFTRDTPAVTIRTWGPQLRAAELVSPAHGWALVQEKLVWTADGGARWQEITPDVQRILGVSFHDPLNGWLVAQTHRRGEINILRTHDGGKTWGKSSTLLYDEAILIEQAFIEILDERTLWVALRLPSSSNFSLGQLFASQDGGHTWQKRSIPLGEAVHFMDAQEGWTAGGPSGNQIFSTQDGGLTWRLKTNDIEIYTDASTQPTPDLSLALPSNWAQNTLPEGTVSVSTLGGKRAWVVVQRGNCQGSKQPDGGDPLQCDLLNMLLATEDGGQTWREITPYRRDKANAPSEYPGRHQ